MTTLPIPTRFIGNSGLMVTELGFGAATLGNLYAPVPDDVADQALDAAIADGFRYVDTAPYYGFGLSERRVGDVLRRHPGMIVSTKAGRLLVPDPTVRDDREREGFHSAMPFRAVFDYSYDAILRSHADSLQRLGVARIDILYVHDIGQRTHGDREAFHFDALTKGGGLRALEQLRASGEISAFGVGANESRACEQMMDHAKLNVILLAGRYTLLEQEALSSLFPRCAANGTKVVIGGPYNSGILATGANGPGPLHYDYGEASPAIVARVQAIEALCDTHGVPLAAAALQFPLAHAVVASIIPGIDSARRAKQALELYRTNIPDEFWLALRANGLIDEAAPIPQIGGTA